MKQDWSLSMKEINIATIIANKRKEKGVTQDDLAAYIGVSKASVSKWETGQSYPDITFLPQLAAYFNISIDALMGYSPQMTKEDIKKLYISLCSDFVSKPFEEVMEECGDIVKKYYSCFPLLFQMAALMVNHFMIAPDKVRQDEIINEVLRLCHRISNESSDINLSKNAINLEAVCYQVLGKPEEILNLFGEEVYPMSGDTEKISLAYQQMGNIQKAKEVIQIALYQHLIFLIADSSLNIKLNADNIEKVDMILKRAVTVGDLYDMDYLHPNTMVSLYLAAAEIYCAAGYVEQTINMLERYLNVCITYFFPCSLHGDSFFDLVDNWFEDFDLGNNVPRNDEMVKKSLIQAVEVNPAFHLIADNPRYKCIIEKLKKDLGG